MIVSANAVHEPMVGLQSSILVKPQKAFQITARALLWSGERVRWGVASTASVFQSSY